MIAFLESSPVLAFALGYFALFILCAVSVKGGR